MLTAPNRGDPANRQLCRGCFRELPEESFCRNRRSPNGRRDTCRACAKIEQARYKETQTPEQAERELARHRRSNARKAAQRRDDRRERNRWARQVLCQLVARGLTYQDIAEATGFSRKTIAAYHRDDPDRQGWNQVPQRLSDLLVTVINAQRDPDALEGRRYTQGGTRP